MLPAAGRGHGLPVPDRAIPLDQAPTYAGDMPGLSVNGVDLYYEEQGEGIPILGVHGTPSSAVMWADAARELSLHGRCIIYDRRGFHRSAPAMPFATLDLVDHVDDAAALLAALHAGPAVVIGRSTGGLIAVELARRFTDKVKALVLLEPALFTIDPDADAWARNLRLKVLERTAGQPELLAQAIFREVLGAAAWECRQSSSGCLRGPSMLSWRRSKAMAWTSARMHWSWTRTRWPGSASRLSSCPLRTRLTPAG